MKSFALSLLSFSAAVLASPALEKRYPNCGVNYQVFPQDKVDPVYPTLSKEGSVLPDFTNKMPLPPGIAHELYFAHAKGQRDSVTVHQTTWNQPWYTIINYQFYVRACADGPLTFTLVGPQDDLTAIWTGNKAYKEFTLPKADITRFWADARGPADASFNVEMKAGQVLPVRIVSMNGDGPAGMNVRITGPINRNGGRGIYIGKRGEGVREIMTVPPPNAQSPEGPVQPFPTFPFPVEESSGY